MLNNLNQKNVTLQEDLKQIIAKLDLDDYPITHYMAALTKGMMTDICFQSFEASLTEEQYRLHIFTHHRLIDLLQDIDLIKSNL